MVHLLPHPPRALGLAGPEQKEQVAFVDTELKPTQPSVARLEVEHVLEIADPDQREHLYALQDLVAILRRVRDERGPIAAGEFALRFRLARDGRLGAAAPGSRMAILNLTWPRGAESRLIASVAITVPLTPGGTKTPNCTASARPCHTSEVTGSIDRQAWRPQLEVQSGATWDRRLQATKDAPRRLRVHLERQRPSVFGLLLSVDAPGILMGTSAR